jgi:hypothetical protein
MVSRMLLSAVRSTAAVATGHHSGAHLPKPQVCTACEATGNSLQCFCERVIQASDQY